VWIFKSIQLWNLSQERLVKFFKTPMVKFLKLDTFEKIQRTHMTSPNSSHLYSVHWYKMFAAESLGSHQLNSFAAFLKDNLHTSSETSKVQSPQVRKMADGKRPQKGGKRLETNTAFEILEDMYDEYCTPDKATHGKENKNQRKVRIQRIERRWARNGGNIAMLLPST
jgi:hypothetical protein